MSQQDVIRAWTDPVFRDSLSPTQLGMLPENPAGRMELTDRTLTVASGLDSKEKCVGTTAITCTAYTWHGYKSCCF